MSGFWSSETLKRELPRLIEPYDSTRVIHCSYELSMGNEAWVTHRDHTKTRVKVMLDIDERVNIPAGQFALLLVDEVITIPSNAIGLISMKSKAKMRGLINVSGFHVDPGYKGKLVFGVFNAGSKAITLTQGEPTFLLWYVSLDEPTEGVYCGSRQNVVHITDDQVMSLTGPTFNPSALAERVSRLEKRRDRWSNLWAKVIIAVISALIVLVVTGIVDVTIDVPWLFGK